MKKNTAVPFLFFSATMKLHHVRKGYETKNYAINAILNNTVLRVLKKIAIIKFIFIFSNRNILKIIHSPSIF